MDQLRMAMAADDIGHAPPGFRIAAVPTNQFAGFMFGEVGGVDERACIEPHCDKRAGRWLAVTCEERASIASAQRRKDTCQRQLDAWFIEIIQVVKNQDIRSECADPRKEKVKSITGFSRTEIAKIKAFKRR